jgi:dihydrofolate reductase
VGIVKVDISVSVDGFVAGPEVSREEPLGRGGMELHEWVLATQSWRAQHGQEGGAPGVDNDVVVAASSNIGAVIMGRRMFGAEEGPWGDDAWEGWWHDDPPFQCPVFVLTHYERAPLPKGTTTFHFVTDGPESALEQAKAAAGPADISIGGGAETIEQYLRLGAVDELQTHVVPIFLGGGTRLFDDVPAGRLELIEVVDSPTVTHVRYRPGA